MKENRGQSDSSSDEEDSSDDEDLRRGGRDHLYSSNYMDIPRVEGIPIVSVLAESQNKEKKSSLE